MDVRHQRFVRHALTPEEAGAYRLAQTFLALDNPRAAKRRLELLLDARRHAPNVRVEMLIALANACVGCLDQAGATAALDELLSMQPEHAEAVALQASLAERPLKDPNPPADTEAGEIPLPTGPELEGPR